MSSYLETFLPYILKTLQSLPSEDLCVGAANQITLSFNAGFGSITQHDEA